VTSHTSSNERSLLSGLLTRVCTPRHAAALTLGATLNLLSCTAKKDVETETVHERSDASVLDGGARSTVAKPTAVVSTHQTTIDGGASNGATGPNESSRVPDSPNESISTASPTTTEATAQPDRTLAIPARIEAEEFVRYNETDAPMDDNECGDGRVDMGLTDDADGECYVGWTQSGEWLEYDVWSPSANVYSVTLRLASGDSGRELGVLVDGEEVGRVIAPGLGWTQYEDVVLEDVTIGAGIHTVRVVFTSGQTNFNYLVFDAKSNPAPEPTGSAAPDSSSDTDDADPDPTDITVPVGEGCAAAATGYELVWSDEFDYEGLPDAQRWGYEVGGDGWGNGELQYYTDARRDNATVGDGVLTITAIPEQYEGNEYISAKLNSAYGLVNPGSWNEGIVRIRARLPSGLGTWPALWMMPNNCPEGWPACGEIDIMEHVGYDEGTVHGTIHTDAFNHVEGTQRGQSVLVQDATSEFHEYAFIWQAQRLQWLVDGEVYFTIDKAAGWGFAEWPFNEKSWHLKVNLAVGGAWGGAEGVNRDDFPAQFEIDHVCVYQAAP
jgi:beta-glucanase (GH16 family)